MAGEYEVRHGWQNLEAQLREVVDQRFALRHYALARLLEPCIVLYGGTWLRIAANPATAKTSRSEARWRVIRA
jgi:hypothetical protein